MSLEIFRFCVNSYITKVIQRIHITVIFRTEALRFYQLAYDSVEYTILRILTPIYLKKTNIKKIKTILITF